MADKIWIVCLLCAGNGVIQRITGINQTEEIPCPRCNEEKVEFTGAIEDTAADARGAHGMVSKTNVFRSYIVLEELDTTEYNALTDAQKEGINTLLSCGKVDLNDGKAGRVRLWNWFGAESTTVANLTELIT